MIPLRGLAAALILSMVAAACGASSSHARELRATPSSFDRVFASARGGDTIRLTSGRYGEFRGSVKSSRVTIRPQRGASATMSLRLSRAANLRLVGMTLDGAEIRGSSRNIRIERSRFTDVALVDTSGGMVDAGIVFDRDTFSGINVCDSCHEGRLTVAGSAVNTRPVGVTVKNSLFNGGGNADGIQVGSYGVRVIHNEFTGLHTVDAVHTDALQLYGQRHTVIRGNYFHDVVNGIVAFDGAEGEVIEHNVIDTETAITLVSDNGSLVRHNTLTGNLRLGYKPEYPSGHGTVIRDNVFRAFDTGHPSNRYDDESHNLVALGPATGRGDIRARPRWIGGGRPSSVAGFALRRGSPGYRGASDGTDRGAATRSVGRTGAPVPAARRGMG